MFLLPGAERYRRGVFCAGLVVFLVIQAVFPWQPLEDGCNRLIGPLTRPITELSAAAAEVVVPTAEPAEKRQALEHSVLVEMERRLGKPDALPGMEWLEVPVVSLETEVGRVTLAAGSDFHIASGQVVAYGDRYLGRVTEVGAHQTTVELVTAPNVRTGVMLQGRAGIRSKAVSLGRGRAGPAVLPWLQEANHIAEGQSLTWRPRPLDPPNLHAAQLRLGVTKRIGDEQRGTAVWTIDGSLPTAAEGRLYVAASAVGERLVAEPLQVQRPARRLLLDDAVLGSGWCAVAADIAVKPAVFAEQGQVGGWCSSWRGNWGWFRIAAPASWQSQAVALQSETTSVLGQKDWQQVDEALPLFTRGGNGVPRGLWLGFRNQAARLPSSELSVIVQADGVVEDGQ